MKIRQDFVTNSSSTSFGAATVTGFASAIMTALGISMAVTEHTTRELKKPDKKAADSDEPDRNFDPDALIQSDLSLEAKQEKIDREIEAYKKEWKEAQKSLEGEDLQKTNQEYENYIEYLNSKKQDAEAVEFEREVAKIEKEAEAEYKQTWIDERKKDLENAREQISMIEASIRGYGKAGYNIDESNRQLEMYKQRENDLVKQLKSEGVEHHYSAREREDIGPSKSVGELVDKVNAKYDDILKQLEKEKIDRRKKEIIRENIEALRAESDAQMAYANTADQYLKTAEIIQTAADIGVDALEKVTGPAGKAVKKAYVAGKALGAGASEAYNDPENASSHLLKATIKAAADVGKEMTDTQIVKDGITMVSETSQGAIDAYQKGESVIEGAGKGLVKTAVDAAGDRITGKYAPDNSMPNLDFGKRTGKEIYKSVVNKDPIIRTVIKDAMKDSMKNNSINQIKNIPKGEGFVFGDVKAY